jgi:hypothetical protein
MASMMLFSLVDLVDGVRSTLVIQWYGILFVYTLLR